MSHKYSWFEISLDMGISGAEVVILEFKEYLLLLICILVPGK